jgi:hypothetical protein
MEVTPITSMQFPVPIATGRDQSGELATAIQGLKIGTGVSTPCIWKHHGKPSRYSPNGMACRGTSTAHSAARRGGIRVRTACRDGVFYVLRIKPKEA